MPTLTVSARPFANALATVLPAASRDDARPILSGVHVRPLSRPFRVELLACDNYRAAFATLTGEVARVGKVAPFTLRLADAQAIAKAIPKPKRREFLPALTFMWRRDGTIRVAYGEWSLDCRPLDYNGSAYPNVDVIQPKGRVIARVDVNAKLLAGLVAGFDDAISIEVRKPPKGAVGGLVAYRIVPFGQPGSYAILMPVRLAH